MSDSISRLMIQNSVDFFLQSALRSHGLIPLGNSFVRGDPFAQDSSLMAVTIVCLLSILFSLSAFSDCFFHLIVSSAL